MSDDDIDLGNRNCLCGIIYVAYEFADVEYQRRVWLEGTGPEVADYWEAVCGLFDDFVAERFLDGLARRYGFTFEMEARLGKFLSVLEDFHRGIPLRTRDRDIVKRLGWTEVVSSAAAFLDVAVIWLVENCGDYPMSKWSWAGKTFGSA
jgi:hypothetical protein